MWLAVASEHASRAAGMMRAQWASGLAEEALQSAERAVDLDAEQALCPACDEPFAPSALRCPACGLRFG